MRPPRAIRGAMLRLPRLAARRAGELRPEGRDLVGKRGVGVLGAAPYGVTDGQREAAHSLKAHDPRPTPRGHVQRLPDRRDAVDVVALGFPDGPAGREAHEEHAEVGEHDGPVAVDDQEVGDAVFVVAAVN